MIMDASNLSNSGTSATKGNEEKVKISINHRSSGCWLVVFHCHCAPSAAEEHLRSVKSFMDLRLFYVGGKKMLTEEEGTAVMQDLVVWKMLFFKWLSWVRYTIKYTDIRHVHLYIFFVLGATMGELRPHVAGSIRGHCDVTGLPSFRVQRWLSCLRCWEILYCLKLNRVHALWNEKLHYLRSLNSCPNLAEYKANKHETWQGSLCNQGRCFLLFDQSFLSFSCE